MNESLSVLYKHIERLEHELRELEDSGSILRVKPGYQRLQDKLEALYDVVDELETDKESHVNAMLEMVRIS